MRCDGMLVRNDVELPAAGPQALPRPLGRGPRSRVGSEMNRTQAAASLVLALGVITVGCGSSRSPALREACSRFKNLDAVVAAQHPGSQDILDDRAAVERALAPDTSGEGAELRRIVKGISDAIGGGALSVNLGPEKLDAVRQWLNAGHAVCN